MTLRRHFFAQKGYQAILFHSIIKNHLTGLQSRLVLFVCLLVLPLMLVAGGMYSAMLGHVLEKEIGNGALHVAQTLAHTPIVRELIHLPPDPDGKLQKLAESIRVDIGAEFIVIGTRDSIRLSHPQRERIGETMVGGDNDPALEEGKSYISKAVGTLGPSIRGKTPILDDQGNIVGIISVGYLLNDVQATVKTHQNQVRAVMAMLILLGIGGAITIARRFKKAIFDLEPEQIAQLFTERDTIIQSIREGIVAIDRNAEVTVVNQQALEILGKNDKEQVVGRHIRDVLPGAKLTKILAGGEQRVDQELIVGDRALIINTVPMVANAELCGAVASFRSKDEIDTLVRQLSQVKEYSQMLRAQTHEYSNKLHTIAGLIQVGHAQQALELISKESAGYQGLIAFLARAVPHPILAAFLIGKYNHSKELHIDFIIDPESQLIDVPASLNREKTITIVGNLIDNAFDAALSGPRPPQVKLTMTDIGNDLVFEVEDSGVGVAADLSEEIFTRGYTTKGSDRGQGLFLVKMALDDLGGEITISDSDLGGALFSVFIPKHTGGKSGA